MFVKIMVPLGALNIRCRIIIGIQTGPIILTTTHMGFRDSTAEMENQIISLSEHDMEIAIFWRTTKKHTAQKMLPNIYCSLFDSFRSRDLCITCKPKILQKSPMCALER